MKGILKALAPKLVDVVASSNPVAGTVLKMATRKLGLPENSTPEQIEDEIAVSYTHLTLPTKA